MTNEKMLELLKAEEYYKLEIALLENIRADVEKSKGSKSSDLSIIKRITEYEKKMNELGQQVQFAFKELFFNNYFKGKLTITMLIKKAK